MNTYIQASMLNKLAFTNFAEITPAPIMPQRTVNIFESFAIVEGGW